jgi:hypothetical protein
MLRNCCLGSKYNVPRVRLTFQNASADQRAPNDSAVTVWPQHHNHRKRDDDDECQGAPVVLDMEPPANIPLSCRRLPVNRRSVDHSEAGGPLSIEEENGVLPFVVAVVKKDQCRCQDHLDRSHDVENSLGVQRQADGEIER